MTTLAGRSMPGSSTRSILLAALVLLAPAAARASPAHVAKATGGNVITGTVPAGLTLGPVFTALWLTGKDPSESAGGPFVYLFSSTRVITCADAVKGAFPKNTLLIELVIGATKPSNKGLMAHSDPPGSGNLYATWLKTPGGFAKESPATTGHLNLTGYHVPNGIRKSVTGTFTNLGNAAKQFDVSGSFNATWCQYPLEI